MKIVSRSLTVTLSSAALALLLNAGCAPKATETAAVSPPPVATPAAPDAKSPEPAATAPAKVLKAQTLTEKVIKECIAAAKDPKLEEITNKYKGQVSGVQAGLASMTASAEVIAVVKKHGFADWEEWAGTTSKLWVGAYRLGVDKALKEMNAKGLPPEAAKAMAGAQEQMKQGVDEAEKNVGKLTDAELKVVEKMLPEIEKMTGSSQGK